MSDGVPDALRVPQNWRGTSPDVFKRCNHLMDLCEPLLGVEFGGCHASPQPVHGEYFVRANVADTLCFPGNHPRYPKQSRYVWVEKPDVGKGVYFGYLKPEAKEDAAA